VHALTFAGFLDILCYTGLFFKVDVTLRGKNAIFFISYSLNCRVLLDGVTGPLENAQQPENSSHLELGSQGERMRGAGALYRIMWYDLPVNPH
jgi:hypothetical protein